MRVRVAVVLLLLASLLAGCGRDQALGIAAEQVRGYVGDLMSQKLDAAAGRLSGSALLAYLDLAEALKGGGWQSEAEGLEIVEARRVDRGRIRVHARYRVRAHIEGGLTLADQVAADFWLAEVGGRWLIYRIDVLDVQAGQGG